MEHRAHSQDSPCGIYGGESDSAAEVTVPQTQCLTQPQEHKKALISIFLFVSFNYGLQLRQHTTLKYRPSYMGIGV